jgi:predicted outer membrane repeat protein
MRFSSIHSWLKGAGKATLRGLHKTGPSRRPKRTCRLGLEVLEDRLVPATFTVTTPLDVVDAADGQLSLREAITRANANPGADTIVLPAGIHRLALPGADNSNAGGDFDVTGSTLFQGAGADATVIDGQQLDRVFDVLGTAPGSIQVTFQGLTIRNGLADAGGGGGIRVGNADLVVQDCAVTGNRTSGVGGGISNAALPGTGNVTLVRTTVNRNVAAGQGGGIKASTASLTNSTVSGNHGDDGGGIEADTANLTNSTVSGNLAGEFGGGIHAGTLTLTNSTVTGNRANDSGGGLAVGEATLTDSTVSGNSAFDGAGGISAGTVTLTRSTVSGNSAGGDGGGILASTVTLIGTTVSGNHAGRNGGGIDATTATLTNSTVSGNTAISGNGGGIDAVALTLVNVTVADNSAHTGGGVFLANGGTSSVRNTIIAENLVDFGGAGPDLSGAFTSGGHNLIGDGTGATGFVNGTNGDQVGTAARPIDPRLGPLANNGGPTLTHALLPDSPAINRGDNTDVPATDQRGGQFLRSVGPTDIGAFEVQPPAPPPPPPPPPPSPVVEIQVTRVKLRTRVDVVVDGALRRRFFPFGAFTGRVQVQRMDVNGDGLLDVVARATISGKRRMRTFVT